MNRKLNASRLQNILDDMEECLASMEDTIAALDRYDSFVRKRLLRSFRPEMMGFKELLGEYTSHCLRTVSVSVNEMSYLEGIRQTVELGYLKAKDYDFMMKLTRLRNRTAHGYNKPTEEELIRFYEMYKADFQSVYETIQQVCRECEAQ